MNFVTKSLIKGEIRGRIIFLKKAEALKKVKASSLPILDFYTGPWLLINLSYSLIKLARGLIQEFCKFKIWKLLQKKKNKSKDVIFLNKLTKLLGIKFLKL